MCESQNGTEEWPGGRPPSPKRFARPAETLDAFPGEAPEQAHPPLLPIRNAFRDGRIHSQAEGFDTANMGTFSNWRANGLPVRTP